MLHHRICPLVRVVCSWMNISIIKAGFRHRILRYGLGALFIAVHGSPSWADDSARRSVGMNQTLIDDLVERLGSPSYATRLRAKESLQRLGLEAFDALHKAQFHPDSEIAMAARHLVSSLMVSWSKDTDPQGVRDALEDYGAQGEAERASRMDLLAELPERQGLEALVRLTRFETSLRLSRQAALLLMQQPMSEDPDRRQAESQTLLSVLGENDRQASDWLRVYAQDLATGNYSATKWRELIDNQRRDIDAATTQQASRATVLELTRVCASRAAKLGMNEEAIDLAAEHMDLIPPTTRDLIDAATWGIDHQLYPFVLELRKQHPRMFEQQPVLLYGAAEAMLRLGDSETAESLAQEALRINPLPMTEEEKNKKSPKDLEDIAQAHQEIGQELRQRGLFRWAEREFVQIIDSLEVNSLPAATARLNFAMMLGELLRHQDVVDVLDPLWERYQRDDQFANRLNLLQAVYSPLESLLKFHKGLRAIEVGDFAAARPLLREAFELDARNIDILIAMYRTEGDEDWKSLVSEKLQRHIRLSQLEVQQADALSRQQGRTPNTEQLLATALNGYAWLVSNTEGNYRQALDYSLRSLEIIPDEPAMLDTCARCYFSVGDLENAVRMQRRAVKHEPHSPPMLRQLQQFEAAMGEQVQ